MPFSKMVSQPRMFSEKLKGGIAFKQLKSFTNTNCSGELNKDMHMVNSNMQFINFESMPDCNIPYEDFTINPNKLKLERVSCIFRFPDKMESILSEAVAKTFQIHFLTPQTFIRNKVLTMFDFNLIQEGTFYPFLNNNSQELNLTEVQQLSSQA